MAARRAAIVVPHVVCSSAEPYPQPHDLSHAAPLVTAAPKRVSSRSDDVHAGHCQDVPMRNSGSSPHRRSGAIAVSSPASTPCPPPRAVRRGAKVAIVFPSHLNFLCCPSPNPRSPHCVVHPSRAIGCRQTYPDAVVREADGHAAMRRHLMEVRTAMPIIRGGIVKPPIHHPSAVIGAIMLAPAAGHVTELPQCCAHLLPHRACRSTARRNYGLSDVAVGEPPMLHALPSSTRPHRTGSACLERRRPSRWLRPAQRPKITSRTTGMAARRRPASRSSSVVETCRISVAGSIHPRTA